MYQKKKGKAYKRTITWAAIMAGVVLIFAVILFVAGMVSFPLTN